MDAPQHLYQYENLQSETSFRVAELLPGQQDDPIAIKLHHVEWTNPIAYETISYAWGNPTAKADVICHGKLLEVTKSLHTALIHLRFQDRNRFLWVDQLCINQENTPERSRQVKQMQKIYNSAKTVLIWLGPDTPEEQQAKAAVDAIVTISDYICEKVGVSVDDLSTIDDVYQTVVFENRNKLPLPDAFCKEEEIWNPLRWFYSHGYFSRLWIIQEVNARTTSRPVHIGREVVSWDRVALVAGYIIMETAFSKSFGFTDTYCWWAALVSTERFSRPKNWLFLLYLASNFKCLDPRDRIYSLRGLMSVAHGAELLDPDYDKSQLEVYRNSVEVALMSFENTDVLTYITSPPTDDDDVDGKFPSWIPLWNKSMLFRNPFRFGKTLPWKPAGSTKPIWSIDKDSNILHLTGSIIDRIKYVQVYDESVFGNAMIGSEQGRGKLKQIWQRILNTARTAHGQTILDNTALTAIASSFSFGLDEKSDPADEQTLLHNFIAYLTIALGEETTSHYVPRLLSNESKTADGALFGKPVWDFEYPQSTFFMTESGLTGCCISTVAPGDVVSVILGSTYPFILRPRSPGDGNSFTLRGYSFVHGIMRGERGDRETRDLKIH